MLADGTHTLTVLGRQVRVDVRSGSNPDTLPLLLLMGLGGNIEMWEPFRSRLADLTGATTVAFDIPGTGASPAPRLPWPLAAHGLLSTRLADAVGLETFDLLGVSWGGLLAQQVAFFARHRVRRVVLANTNFGLGSIPGRGETFRVLATPKRYLSTRGLVKAAVAFGGAARQLVPADSAHMAARLNRPPSRRGYYYQLLALTGWSSLPALPLIRQPVLVLNGDDDPAVPVTNSRILARLIPDARLVVIPGGGHLMLFERTAETAAAVADFLMAPDNESI